MFEAIKKFFSLPKPMTEVDVSHLVGTPRPNEYGIIDHPSFMDPAIVTSPADIQPSQPWPRRRVDISMSDNADSLRYQPNRTLNTGVPPRRRISYSFEQTHPNPSVFNPTAIGVSGVVTGIDWGRAWTGMVSGTINVDAMSEPLFTKEQIQSVLTEMEEREKAYIVPDTIVPGVL